MADQTTVYTTFDGKQYPDQATADTHETAADEVITDWAKDVLDKYVAAEDRLAAGKAVFAAADIKQAVRRVP